MSLREDSDAAAKGDAALNPMDKQINRTLKNVQGLLTGRTFPGRIRLTRVPLDGNRAAGAALASPREERSSPDYDEDEYRLVSDGDPGGAAAARQGGGGDGPAQALPGGERAPDGGAAAGKPPACEPQSAEGGRATDSARVARFKKELSAPTVDLDALRELAWSGVPPDMRPNVWRLLLGYAPPNADRREAVLARKRTEYQECVPQYYDISNEERTEDEIHMLRQISVDVPRTVPDVPFFQQPLIQTALERILYIWAIRHPASGYVQGINDLVTPFLTVFLAELFPGAPSMDSWALAGAPPGALLRVEADCYWCLSKLLEGIQDHYTFAQPGIQRLVFKLKELVRRIDEPVSRRIEEQGLEFLQFAFRWFNCLLIREVPFALVTRLFDTYLAEGDGFADFLVYVSASFMLTWTEKLCSLDFQEMVIFLQHLPTRRWSHQELEMVLSRAFMWRVMFDRSPNHLHSS